MALKPEASLITGLSVGALVIAVYSKALPSQADIRVGAPQDQDIDSARKSAAWTSAGVCAAVSLIAQDATVFILGGMITVGMDWWVRHANASNPGVTRFLPGPIGSQDQPQTTDDMDVTGVTGLAA
jgi:hypothetical protein